MTNGTASPWNKVPCISIAIRTAMKIPPKYEKNHHWALYFGKNLTGKERVNRGFAEQLINGVNRIVIFGHARKAGAARHDAR